MVPILFPAGCLFFLSLVPTTFALAESDKEMIGRSILLLALVLAAFLNQETTWKVKLLSALMIVLSWFAAGLIETRQTGFSPPRELLLFSSVVMTILAFLSVFAGSILLRRIRLKLS